MSEGTKFYISNMEVVEILIKERDKLQADKNKLINYIAIRENKTYEEVCKEFDI